MHEAVLSALPSQYTPQPSHCSFPQLPSQKEPPSPLTQIMTLSPGFLSFILALVRTARSLHKRKPDTICPFTKIIQWLLIILKEKKIFQYPLIWLFLLSWLRLSPPTLPHPSCTNPLQRRAADSLACPVFPTLGNVVSVSGPLIGRSSVLSAVPIHLHIIWVSDLSPPQRGLPCLAGKLRLREVQLPVQTFFAGNT